MTNAIWKFLIKTADYENIALPVGARILCVQTQLNKPYIWALCDVDAQKENRLLHTYSTGEEFEFDPKLVYIGTYQRNNGSEVYHVFEEPK